MPLNMTTALAALTAAALLAAPGTPDEDRATDLLARARTALGGAERLAEVKSLTLRGPLRKLLGTGDDAPELSGEARVDVLLPGRYLRVESLSPFPGAASVSVLTGLDGEDAWTDQETPPSAHGTIMIRRAPEGGDAAPQRAVRVRADYARLLVALLLADPTVALGFRHHGTAESPEGRADVLDVTGPDGFTARLFLDAASHRPLMLSYRARRGMMVRRLEGGPHADPSEIDKAPLPSPPPEVEARLHLEDFRPVGGLVLPHRLSTTYDGQPGDEWQVKEYKVNPPLKPEAFRRRK
jgi:hypothetical protein